MSRGPFEKRVVVWLSVIGGVSLVAFLLLMFFGADISGVNSAGSDAYSRSAVGHHAFVALLEKLGVTVNVSRFKSADKARDEAVLVIAEPRLGGIDDERAAKLKRMLTLADKTILVLPKRLALEDEKRPGWIAHAPLMSRESVEDVITAAGIEADLVRVGERELPPVFPGGEIEGRPYLKQVQLLRSATIRPLLASNRGILVGEIQRGDRTLIVLADPDLLSTHGLSAGDNAVVAAATVFRLLSENRAVLIDETMHGHELPPNIWRALFVYPLSLATCQVFLVFLILIWAAVGRFGAPLPGGAGPAQGKDVLIANTADLLVFGGHVGSVLTRYFSTTVLDLARTFNCPPGLSSAETMDWVNRLGRKRGLRTDLGELRPEIRASSGNDRRAAERLSAVAMKVHRYKEEILDGSGSR